MMGDISTTYSQLVCLHNNIVIVFPTNNLITFHHTLDHCLGSELNVGIDTEFEVMAATPQTPKCHHNRGLAEVMVTFRSL